VAESLWSHHSTDRRARALGLRVQQRQTQLNLLMSIWRKVSHSIIDFGKKDTPINFLSMKKFHINMTLKTPVRSRTSYLLLRSYVNIFSNGNINSWIQC
jgi:hypothetical protein